MLKKKNILKVLILGILSLGLISCESKTEEKSKVVSEVIENKSIVIGENLELYNGISIVKISLIEEKDKAKIEVELKTKDIEALKKYNLKIHARPLENFEIKEKIQNWDISLKNIIEKNGKYFVSRDIEIKNKEYELKVALFKIEKTEDGLIKYPNFGNQLFLELKL
ncbi:hypothetical protein [Cetobacterium somerae]|uniref:hypothetical protein n=1 Tax=Cetobacterium somerae TaxID=188913 RepID=UPI00248E5F87|nr:hypothetical protein [Cetobacterium somerae]